MTTMKKLVDRRRQERFQVQEGASVGLGPHYNNVGQIIDLSMGGLAFHYAGSKESSRRLWKLDILLTDGNFYLGKVPFGIISDFEITDKEPSDPTTTRRSSVQFGNLTHYQKYLLGYFIENHTIGEVQPRPFI
jgi:hypothetical protein